MGSSVDVNGLCTSRQVPPWPWSSRGARYGKPEPLCRRRPRSHHRPTSSRAPAGVRSGLGGPMVCRGPGQSVTTFRRPMAVPRAGRPRRGPPCHGSAGRARRTRRRRSRTSLEILGKRGAIGLHVETGAAALIGDPSTLYHPVRSVPGGQVPKRLGLRMRPSRHIRALRWIRGRCREPRCIGQGVRAQRVCRRA